MMHILSNCHLALNRYTWRHNEVLKVLTEMAKEQVEEGKYAPQPQIQGLDKIEFVPLYRKEARFLAERRQTKPWKAKVVLSQSGVEMGGSCSVSQGRICSGAVRDSSPVIPTTKKPWQGIHWSANFEVTGMTRPRKNPIANGIRTRDLPLSRWTPYH